MKIKVLFPLVCLALLIASPQAEAQSKRSERKLKREMQKLEKQMKKVQELKHESYFPLMEEIEFKKAKELEKIHEYKNLQWEMNEDQRQQIREQAAQAREMAAQYREMDRDKMRKYQNEARQYQRQAVVHQREAQEHLRQAFEDQRHEYKKIREAYPKGIHFEEIEIPEMDFEIPEFDFEFPEMEFEFEGKPVKIYKSIASLNESDNNLSINTDLDNESIDKSYSFTVSEEASYLSLRAKGSVSSGSIEIEIINPQNKEFQTIELSPAADVDWSQKVKLTDETKKNLKGKWSIRIKGDDVKGHFGVSLRSR